MKKRSGQDNLEDELRGLGDWARPLLPLVDGVMPRVVSLPAPRRTRLCKKPWRVFVGLAACALAALVVAFFSSITSPVSAADQLKREVEMTRDFKGWVHIRYSQSFTGGSSTNAASTTAPATQPSLHIAHFDTIDGTSLSETTLADGRRCVEMRVPSQHLWYLYDGLTNELRIASTTTALAKSFMGNSPDVPATASELLAQLQSAQPSHPLEIVREQEGKLTRFSIQGIGDDRSGKAIILVNEHNNGIQKVIWPASKNGISTAEYTYGPPEFHSIYDAGVSRDAKIVDGRPPADVEQIVTRLHDRVVKGYGDGVAILTREESWVDGRPDPSRGEVELYAREGDKAVWSRYFSIGMPTKQRGLAPRPDHWPLPKLNDVLVAFRGALPAETVVVDGGNSWKGGIATDLDHFRPEGQFGSPAQNIYLYGVASRIWPSRESMGTNVPGGRIEVLKDEQRPAMVGLQCDEGGNIEPGRNPVLAKQRIIYWVNPSREDMPVETILAENPSAAGTPPAELRTTYKDYEQLPDGRWFPSYWEVVPTRTGAPASGSRKILFRLQVLPGAKLGGEWYTDPGKRFAEVGSVTTPSPR